MAEIEKREKLINMNKTIVQIFDYINKYHVHAKAFIYFFSIYSNGDHLGFWKNMPITNLITSVKHLHSQFGSNRSNSFRQDQS